MAVAAQDVSVVVQGPVTPWTPAVLESVREHLPGAETVLSTWQGSATDRLRELAVVVESVDPGPGPPVPRLEGSGQPPPMNTQRMFTSTVRGLQAASRPWALKLRSDTPLVDDGVLRWHEGTGARAGTLFTRRLLTCSVATRPRIFSSFLFHPSDCVHFGPVADVRALWGDGSVDEVANVGWWERQGRRPPSMLDVRFFNEQLLFIGFLRRAGVEVDYEAAGTAASPAQARASEERIVDNFIVLEPWQLGITFPKLAPMIASSSVESYLDYGSWRDADRALRP